MAVESNRNPNPEKKESVSGAAKRSLKKKKLTQIKKTARDRDSRGWTLDDFPPDP